MGGSQMEDAVYRKYIMHYNSHLPLAYIDVNNGRKEQPLRLLAALTDLRRRRAGPLSAEGGVHRQLDEKRWRNRRQECC